MSTPLMATLITAAFVTVVFIVIYNMLIGKRNAVENAFAGMDVQLKKRYELIPNLVATVKQYALHEKELLGKITEMRTKAADNNLSADEKVALDNQISSGMNRIMVAVENYPELKASENFMNLQRALIEAESQISAARRTYNAVVTDFNTAIKTIPGSLLAGIMKLKRKQLFMITEPERQNVEIKHPQH